MVAQLLARFLSCLLPAAATDVCELANLAITHSANPVLQRSAVYDEAQ